MHGKKIACLVTKVAGLAVKRPSDFDQILMHVKLVDGRLGINGLAALANQFYSISRDTCALFVFTSKKASGGEDRALIGIKIV